MTLLLALALAALLPTQAHAQSPTALELLQSADRARGGLGQGITWTVTSEATEEGETTARTFLVKARGNDALVESLAPARYKGEIMLFNDRTIWFVKPGLRKPVSISARQRLTGLAANGDIASTNYARDYEGTIVGEEVVDGEPTWKLELKAKAKNVTYDRIRSWISKKRRLGVKAEFLTVGGEVFKTAAFDYGNRLKNAEGVEFEFVSRMTIRDVGGSGAVTVLGYAQPRAETHPVSIFNINNVVR
jgi:outer membrane lipoprotein-sorting protein